LQAILTPSTTIENGKRVKYSIADSQRAFTVEVVQASDIDAAVNQSNVFANQPLIFAIGNKANYRQFVIVFDKTKHIFETYLGAIDFCFKLIKIFNLKYLSKCQNIWIFIQNFCYGMPIEKKYPKIQTFVNDLKRLMQE